MIELRLPGGAAAECGDALAVEARWDELDQAARSIRISIEADVAIDGQLHVVRRVDAPARLAVGSPGGHGTVEIAIPVDGPVSYRGRLFSIEWRVLAVVELPMARDVQVRGPAFDVMAAQTRLRAALHEAEPPRGGTAEP